MYAIGGSSDPTINSQGNRYVAPKNPFAKEVDQSLPPPRPLANSGGLTVDEMLAGDQESRHSHRRVEELELEVGGGPPPERRLLRPLRCRRLRELRQGFQPRRQVVLHDRVHHLHSRRPSLPRRLQVLAIIITIIIIRSESQLFFHLSLSLSLLRLFIPSLSEGWRRPYLSRPFLNLGLHPLLRFPEEQAQKRCSSCPRSPLPPPPLPSSHWGSRTFNSAGTLSLSLGPPELDALKRALFEEITGSE